MAAAESNKKLLDELVAVSQSLYPSQASTNRRTASLVIPRTSPHPSITSHVSSAENENTKPRSRRISMSPGHFRSKPRHTNERITRVNISNHIQQRIKIFSNEDDDSSEGKKGLWNWKPIRAISHIRMQKLTCLFSVEIIGIQGLPDSMNGLRLAVCVRKKETKDGAVQTMPSRVSNGDADFEETLFARCHVYCTYSSSSDGKQLKFEPRPFLIYVFAIDAKELDFGAGYVDLSDLIKESIQKNKEGTRVRQWEIILNLSGKAQGADLILKLGFQIMEKDGGFGIYSQALGGVLLPGPSTNNSMSAARQQSKSSFSIPSPNMKSPINTWNPPSNLHEMDELDVDKSSSPAQKPDLSQEEDIDVPDFEVVDKGVEFQEPPVIIDDHEAGVRKENVDEIFESSGHMHLTRLTELQSIARQLKDLESMMREDKSIGYQGLEADEETVTREFLQMLEDYEKDHEPQLSSQPNYYLTNNAEEEDPSAAESESMIFLPDLARGLGCVVQTRDGGYLASMNPLDTPMERKETLKLAMQISKPAFLLIQKNEALSGFELFQKMTAIGMEPLSKKLVSFMGMEDLMGKTAEQVAFEGIASAIIHGRNKEVACSSAARTIAAVKTLANATSLGRERSVSSGIWNLNEEPLKADEILTCSLQKIEKVVFEGLKIQAGMAEEEAPFQVSSFYTNLNNSHPLDTAISLEAWMTDKNNGLCEDDDAGVNRVITLSVVVQLRDPVRRYEAVGGPMVVLIQAKNSRYGNEDEGKRFNVASLHVGGINGGCSERSGWDSDKQTVSAMQCLVDYGLGKKEKLQMVKAKGCAPGSFWSISSRVMAHLWLKPVRNPDINFSA